MKTIASTVKHLGSCLLASTLVVGCGPMEGAEVDTSNSGGGVVDEAVLPLSAAECTGANVQPVRVFTGSLQAYSSPGSGATPYHFLQPGCGHAQVIDLQNTDTVNYWQNRITPLPYQIFTDGHGHGTSIPWTQGECPRLQLRFYAWRKLGDGTWQFLNSSTWPAYWDPTNGGACLLPLVLVHGGSGSQSPSDPHVTFELFTATSLAGGRMFNLVENAFYRFGISVRLGASPDDFSTYSEHPFKIDVL